MAREIKVRRLDGDVSRRGEYSWLQAWFAEHPPSARVVVDVGALHRKNSNSWNLIADDGWRGVLVEPHPHAAQRVREQFQGDFVVVEQAVSNYRGQAPFYISKVAGNHSLLKDWRPDRIQRQIHVNVTTLPELLHKQSVPLNFGALSVDTEGNDYKVIMPLLNDSQWRPDAVIHEIGRDASIWAPLMEEAGYSLFHQFEDNMLWTRESNRDGSTK